MEKKTRPRRGGAEDSVRVRCLSLLARAEAAVAEAEPAEEAAAQAAEVAAVVAAVEVAAEVAWRRLPTW